MSEQSKARLQHLQALWRQEQAAVHARFVEERQKMTLAQRVEHGVALRNLAIVDTDAALGGRVMLWLSPQRLNELDSLRVGPGTPVRLWFKDPEEPDAVLGTVAQCGRERVGVVIDEFAEQLEEGGFHLDRDEPQVTFARGLAALERFLQADANGPIGHMREILFGERTPAFNHQMTPVLKDLDLNDSQLEAVAHGLAACDVALIHGPPGTGKTRTLVELIRQAVARGERVLATAASNAAVDNLAERLALADLHVVRLGHPARISPAMEAHTLDALVEHTEDYALSRKWIIEANHLHKRLRSRGARGELSRDQRRELLREMRGLLRDARNQLDGLQEEILSEAQVICATAAGADATALEGMHFDLVVLDEATQATDPIALVPISHGERLVMAGDPCQLPPTVIDLQAAKEGLGTTLFERLAAKEDDLLRMLQLQYRMHQQIMAFPSAQFYGGKLKAHPDVATHTLEELPGVCADPLRPGPLWFIDTAGTGWEELRTDEDPSTSNPGQAERTAKEVRRLLSRGLSPHDIAVITPYDAQVRLLRKLLAPAWHEGLDIGSIDGFQGREKEAIVLDLVRSNDDGTLGFLEDVRRMNVALTRARRFLLVIGDSATLSRSPFYTAFLEHVERTGAYLSAWDDDAPPFAPPES